MNLNNYVAVITGGASGIGEATVRLFIERGAKVVIVDLNEERGSALEAELGERAWFYKADVSDSAQVQAMFQAIEEKYGVVDVLYNNAAYSLSKTLWDTTEEDWDRVMRVNESQPEGVFPVCKICPASYEKEQPRLHYLHRQ